MVLPATVMILASANMAYGTERMLTEGGIEGYFCCNECAILFPLFSRHKIGILARTAKQRAFFESTI